MITMRIAAIIPAYNEQDSISEVVNNINDISKQFNYQIDAIVVNDCSKDKTGKIIDSIKCIAIQLPVNLGIGGAVQTGFIYAHRNGYDFAIQVDGDGQHPACEIPKLIDKIIKNNFDVVIGSRFIDNEGFQSTFMRRRGILFFNRLLKMLCSVQITDSTSGFRIYNRAATELLSSDYPHQYPEPEAVVLLTHKGFKIGEVQVNMRERQGGVSSITSFKSIGYMVRVTLGIIYTYLRLKLSK